jgi:acetoin utilization deacetylase AcuC-like enzyme
MDTFVSEASWEAALTAAGGVRALVDELSDRRDRTGFALARPPGHHATSNQAMGFCLFNNVAVTAAYLRSRGERVAVLDWDVHHGNGTQQMLADDPGALYVSVHQSHFYPFAGELDDIDRGAAKGTTVNIPLPAGTAGDIYRRAWVELVLPVTEQFQPSWVLISAGFDAHADDYLANFNLVADDYGWMATALSRLHPAHRTIVVLEGGYDLRALRQSSRATVLGLVGEFESDREPLASPISSMAALESAATAIGRYWTV